jgi:hypothetical protein
VKEFCLFVFLLLLDIKCETDGFKKHNAGQKVQHERFYLFEYQCLHVKSFEHNQNDMLIVQYWFCNVNIPIALLSLLLFFATLVTVLPICVETITVVCHEVFTALLFLHACASSLLTAGTCCRVPWALRMRGSDLVIRLHRTDSRTRPGTSCGAPSL